MSENKFEPFESNDSGPEEKDSTEEPKTKTCPHGVEIGPGAFCEQCWQEDRDELLDTYRR